MPAQSRDHVVPRAYRDVVFERWPHLAYQIPDTVPSCTECNSIAGAGIFRALGTKRRYIHSEIRRKYAKVLSAPDWTTAELDELGYALRKHVEAGIEAKRITRERLRWRGARFNSR